MRMLFMSCILFLCLGTFGLGRELTGSQIIQNVNECLNVETSRGTSKMTIITTSGNRRTFVFESWSKDKGEKTLIRYLEPSRVKGQATLMLNNADDIWMYFPRTQRVRKLATHAKKQKMEGSDFSYEDMGSGDAFITDFEAVRLEDVEMADYDCYTLELQRKPDGNVSYSRLVMWVIKKKFYPIVIDYYEEENPQRLEKRLTQSDIQIIDGIPTAKKAVMKNQNDNTTTEMEIIEISYDVQLSDDLFTERNLKK